MTKTRTRYLVQKVVGLYLYNPNGTLNAAWQTIREYPTLEQADFYAMQLVTNKRKYRNAPELVRVIKRTVTEGNPNGN